MAYGPKPPADPSPAILEDLRRLKAAKAVEAAVDQTPEGALLLAMEIIRTRNITTVIVLMQEDKLDADGEIISSRAAGSC